MEKFLEWSRDRLVMVDLMNLADDVETLKLMLFTDGPSRDEFIKFLVYKFLLDLDSESEDSQNHDLEKIFVSFGLLDKESAQHFLKCTMPIKLHIITWKIIIEALIPTTTITSQQGSYDELMNSNFEKSNYFLPFIKKNYLPPELVSKLKDKDVLNETNESIDEILNIITQAKNIQIDVNNDFNHVSDFEKSSSNTTIEFMDLKSIKEAIDQYNTISNDNKIILSNGEKPIKMSPQEFFELIKKHNLIHTDHVESAVEKIQKLVKAEQDLQLLVNSFSNQVKPNS